MPGNYQSFSSVANSPLYVAAGSTYTNSVALTDVTPQLFYFSAANLYPGQVIKVTAAGILQQTTSTTLNMGLYYNGVGTKIAMTGPITISASAISTNTPWELEARIAVRSVASSTTFTCWTQGSFRSATAAPGTPTPYSTWAIPGDGAPTTNPLTMSTNSYSLSLAAQWGTTTSTSNQLTCEQYIVEFLN